MLFKNALTPLHFTQNLNLSIRTYSSITPQKITVDNHARFLYQFGYWFRLIDASVYGAKADANAQSAIFESTVPEKQPFILLSESSGKTDVRATQHG